MYRIGKDSPIEAALEQLEGQLLLETAFRKTQLQIIFNRDMTTLFVDKV